MISKQFRKKIQHIIETSITDLLMYRRSPEWGIYSFLQQCVSNGDLLDVGCGFDSPRRVQAMIPQANYSGIDIVPHNTYIDENKQKYLYCKNPKEWHKSILEIQKNFHTIICNHNLEHCDDPQSTLRAIASKLQPGGRLYVAVPSSRSIMFPSRGGTLNYYDDWTHSKAPPTVSGITSVLKESGIDILVVRDSYKPALSWLCGLIQEPFSYREGRIYPGTWAYWGFESVIWATKKPNIHQ